MPVKHEEAWSHFYKGGFYKTNHSYKEARCKACVFDEVRRRIDDERNSRGEQWPEDEVCAEVLKDFKPLCGKPQNLYKHLGRCPDNVQAQDLPPTVAQQLVSALANSAQSTGSDIETNATPNFTSQVRWTLKDRKDFDADLCRLLISGNVTWWAVENPFWQYFFKKWIPGSLMPGRNEISGQILDQESARVVAIMKKEVSGCYGTGQIDSWKNRQKMSVIGSMVNVEYHPYILNIYDVSKEPKTAENLLAYVEKEIDYCTQELNIIIVAYCSDSSSESAKMRRLLSQKRPHIATVPCWAHQVCPLTSSRQCRSQTGFVF
ncbi:hypothetical protein EVG20_g10584 [Dentipellis fragilis]|uniref:DUF659 domain-containing protein n=1 Tax=Dentipellis fragilis TaxID=205917 RepID=A0A4Y9XQE7_9AGAM|nr:hypothetical protein EVG20_g10584 [Dentipellis fragilis]